MVHIPAMPALLSFLLMPWKAAADGLRIGGPVTQMEKLSEAPGSWFKPGPVTAAIQRANPWRKDLISLRLTLK